MCELCNYVMTYVPSLLGSTVVPLDFDFLLVIFHNGS